MQEEKYLDTLFQNVDNSIILDEEQKQAILEDSPYTLLVAGAGSGKTTTMAAKVKYLVERKKVLPEEILVISFTNQATKELQMRINKHFFIPVTICTFHKLGYDILKMAGLDNYQVLQNSSQLIYKYFENNKDPFLVKFFENYFKTNSKDIGKWVHFCNDFLKAWKTKGYLISDFERIQKQYTDKETIQFLSIMKEILQYYEKEMSENHWIDFDDMIILATRNIGKIKLPYRYIMVDEYQDISPIRFQLIEKILKQNGAKLIAVGDDFQSIFGFAGSDITLFADFKTKLGGTVLPITHTYRNSQELIDIAGHFVMKNKRQYQKNLKSSKRVKKPIIIKVYNDQKNQDKALLCALKECLNTIYKENEKATVALLGRYRFEKRILLQDSNFKEKNGQIVYLLHPTLQITFLTVHSSKGLGFDEVILLNGKEDLFGFPSKIKDDFLMRVVKQEDDDILLAEERRLFYVALTRTKHKVYILTPAYHPSLFVLEIKDHLNIEIDDPNHRLSYKRQRICPSCGSRLKRKYHPSIYPYYCCTNIKTCHFKTNSLYYRYPIETCPMCKKGKVIVKKENGFYFLKCNQCHYCKK